MEKRLVGKVKDAHGLKGEIFVIFFSKDYSWASEIEFIWLDEKKHHVLKLSPHKDGLRVLLQGVVNRNESEALIGRQVYVSEDLLQSESGEALFLSEVEGFEVTDSKLGNIGIITGFAFNGAQDLLIVTKTNAEKTFEYEIPFVEAFVEKIDYEAEIIQMNLPEGLLEINVSEES